MFFCCRPNNTYSNYYSNPCTACRQVFFSLVFSLPDFSGHASRATRIIIDTMQLVVTLIINNSLINEP